MPAPTPIAGIGVTVYPRTLKPAPRPPSGKSYRCGAISTRANYQDGRINDHDCSYDATVRGRIAHTEPPRFAWLCGDCAAGRAPDANPATVGPGG